MGLSWSTPAPYETEVLPDTIWSTAGAGFTDFKGELCLSNWKVKFQKQRKKMQATIFYGQLAGDIKVQWLQVYKIKEVTKVLTGCNIYDTELSHHTLLLLAPDYTYVLFDGNQDDPGMIRMKLTLPEETYFIETEDPSAWKILTPTLLRSLDKEYHVQPSWLHYKSSMTHKMFDDLWTKQKAVSLDVEKWLEPKPQKGRKLQTTVHFFKTESSITEPHQHIVRGESPSSSSLADVDMGDTCPTTCTLKPKTRLVSRGCQVLTNKIPMTQIAAINAIKYIPGKKITHKILRHITESKCEAWRHRSAKTHKLILDYIHEYDIDWTTAEKCQGLKSAEECAQQFESKNEFFQRKLAPQFIKIAGIGNPRMFVSPADCRLSAFDKVDIATEYWIKGKGFSIDTLLGGKNYPTVPDTTKLKVTLPYGRLSDSYQNGSLLICRLAPDDYHRFHLPMDCVYMGHYKIPGEFYSVDPRLVNSSIDVYSSNKREVHLLHNDHFGTVLCVVISATCTGSIEINPQLQEYQHYSKGFDFGTFGFGGSTLVLVFPPHTLAICRTFTQNSLHGNETYVKVGNRIGTAMKSLH